MQTSHFVASVELTLRHSELTVLPQTPDYTVNPNPSLQAVQSPVESHAAQLSHDVLVIGSITHSPFKSL